VLIRIPDTHVRLGAVRRLAEELGLELTEQPGRCLGERLVTLEPAGDEPTERPCPVCGRELIRPPATRCERCALYAAMNGEL